MLRKLLVIIIVDILILGPSMYCGDLDPSIAIGLLIYIPVIIVINLAVWFILFSRQSSWAKSVLINSLICPFILSYFFHAGIAKHDADNYKSLYFSQNKGNYKLTLQLEKGRLKDTLEFEFYELGNGSSSTIDLDGKYTSKGDTVFLTTKKGKEMKVFQMVLFDYPMSGDKIKLNAPRD